MLNEKLPKITIYEVAIGFTLSTVKHINSKVIQSSRPFSLRWFLWPVELTLHCTECPHSAQVTVVQSSSAEKQRLSLQYYSLQISNKKIPGKHSESAHPCKGHAVPFIVHQRRVRVLCQCNQIIVESFTFKSTDS